MRDQLKAILEARTRHPQAIAEAAARRQRRASLLGEDHHPSVHGLVIGRSLLFPPGDDVAGAVDTVVSMARGGG